MTQDEANKFQNWEMLDGITAWHLIERHAEDWEEVGLMMEAWLNGRTQKMRERLAEYEKPMMEHGDSVYRKPIQLDDFTLPPINLPSIGKAK